ncbi:DUF6734 family protein [Niabella drilacis]|uniref:DUF6734 domain-containing protein n=1 Tax=Niabella drilacis (strain DSM 25811 / CCM 8410 / CCUG 62505 / LMG 26954 / E90) TaxID=1285928 RepID=A0A1G7AYT8_NIADE|nr:DUF6734 family protein [Niabella drilacis]SDE20058.1 hypothetical protein SAMN04487894_1268 [Niabella drilacis]
MTICQTLWTHKKNLLEDPFGWVSPQHHLMAWALSSLQLNKFYKELELYTDKHGAAILSDTLDLPYKKIITDYDNLDCAPDLWAYPKLLTYARQEKPFIHVDGDVVLWKPFRKKLLTSPLIAQNPETGTAYYNNLFSPYRSDAFFYPEYLRTDLYTTHVNAYNAGILGGTNLSFFRTYFSEAATIIKRNTANPLNTNFNIIFEQVLFYSLSKKMNLEVNCYFEKQFPDNGYGIADVANFAMLPRINYLHFIGPHKRNQNICNQVCDLLYHHYPETFLKITALFRKTHYYFPNKIQEIANRPPSKKNGPVAFTKTVQLLNAITGKINTLSSKDLKKAVARSKNSLLKSLYRYECTLKRVILQFNKIDAALLHKQEAASISGMLFFTLPESRKQAALVYTNPFLEIIDGCYDWTSIQITGNTIQFRSSYEKDIITAIVPGLFFKGHRTFVLDELCANMVLLASQGCSFSTLVDKISQAFPDAGNDPGSVKKLLELKLEILVTNKIIYLSL